MCNAFMNAYWTGELTKSTAFGLCYNHYIQYIRNHDSHLKLLQPHSAISRFVLSLAEKKAYPKDTSGDVLPRDVY